MWSVVLTLSMVGFLFLGRALVLSAHGVRLFYIAFANAKLMKEFHIAVSGVRLTVLIRVSVGSNLAEQLFTGLAVAPLAMLIVANS